MRAALILLLATLALAACGAHAREVRVSDPFLEMHTGPGAGYPIFHVVDRGDPVTLLKTRTGWFKVRTERGAEGWVPGAQLARTLDADGKPLHFDKAQRGDFERRRWEMGVLGGDFAGADLVSVYGSFALSRNLALELWFSQALGRFSDSNLVQVDLVHQMFPHWRVAPFFALGTGVVRTDPKATLVQTEDRSDTLGHVGFGVRTWLTRNFVLRAEYKSYVVFTSRDNNEEVNEWKAGFSFFF